MFKITVEAFLTEAKEEIMAYEELGEQAAARFEQNFRAWLLNGKVKKTCLEEQGGRQYFVMKDEADFFSIVDNYWAAVENGEEAIYWKRFG